MLIVSIKTDAPAASVCIYENGVCIEEDSWQADRQLAETIHYHLDQLLHNNEKELRDVQGFICFKGPGSFTGLRIGLAVANAFAFSLDVPIVATTGTDWVASALKLLADGVDERIVLPEYGAPVNITAPKK